MLAFVVGVLVGIGIALMGIGYVAIIVDQDEERQMYMQNEIRKKEIQQKSYRDL